MHVSLTAVAPTTSADLVLACDDDTRVGDVVEALTTALPGAAGPLVVGTAPVSDDVPVRDAGLLDGMRVGLGDPAPVDPVPATAGWQLHVVSGPDAGGVFSLPVGEHVVGRSGLVGVRDEAMSRRHCAITVSDPGPGAGSGAGSGATLTDLGSSNGTRLDGELLTPHEPVELGLGQMITVGHSVLTVRAARPSDAVTEPAEPGFAHFLRQPRLLPFRVQPEVHVPAAPHGQPPAGSRWPRC